MAALAVETIGLSRRYGRRWALADVSLGVPEGAVVMLAGAYWFIERVVQGRG